MSCFGGRMHEYDRVSLDRFDGKNLQSTVYFLSHLHEDHTVGLGQPAFYRRLKTGHNVFLYCSDVTKVLIQASVKYRHLLPYVKTLDINVPSTVMMPDPCFNDDETVSVTFLPAFHCPGSVMCLFEGKEGNVLYTGDFRWEHFQLEQMEYLRTKKGVKDVKSVYIDTTFCTEETLFIPSRKSCIEAVVHLVQEWVQQGPDFRVYISLRAQYGHEPLLLAIAVRLNQKVHVPAGKLAVYNQIQEFKGHFTADPQETQLHACGTEVQNKGENGEVMYCRHSHPRDKILMLLPTTMYFTQFQHITLDKIIRKTGDNFFRACYSFHSSYTEIQNLLDYLKPQKAYPNVKPPSDASLAEVQHRLNVMLLPSEPSSSADSVYRQLGRLKVRRKSAVKRKEHESLSDTESLDFGSPCKKSKRSATPPPAASEHATQKSHRSPKKHLGDLDQADAQSTTPRKEIEDGGNLDLEGSGDLQLTPCKSVVSDAQSSYAGSQNSGSELDLSQASLEAGDSASGDKGASWTVDMKWTGSLLDAVNINSSLEETGTPSFCVCLLDDIEQTDEQYDDVSQIVNEEEESKDLTLEQLTNRESEKSVLTNHNHDQTDTIVTGNEDALIRVSVDEPENSKQNVDCDLKKQTGKAAEISGTSEIGQSVTGCLKKTNDGSVPKKSLVTSSPNNFNNGCSIKDQTAEKSLTESNVGNCVSHSTSGLLTSPDTEICAKTGKDNPEEISLPMSEKKTKTNSLACAKYNHSVLFGQDSGLDFIEVEGDNVGLADNLIKCVMEEHRKKDSAKESDLPDGSSKGASVPQEEKPSKRVVVVCKAASSSTKENMSDIEDDEAAGTSSSKDVIVIDDDGLDEESSCSSSFNEDDYSEDYDEDSDISELVNCEFEGLTENGKRKVVPRKKIAKEKMRRKQVDTTFDTSDEESDSDETLPPTQPISDEVVCVSSGSDSDDSTSQNQSDRDGNKQEYFKLDRVAMQKTIDKLTESVLKQYQQSVSVQLSPGPSWASQEGFIVTSHISQQMTVQSRTTETQNVLPQGEGLGGANAGTEGEVIDLTQSDDEETASEMPENT